MSGAVIVLSVRILRDSIRISIQIQILLSKLFLIIHHKERAIEHLLRIHVRRLQQFFSGESFLMRDGLLLLLIELILLLRMHYLKPAIVVVPVYWIPHFQVLYFQLPVKDLALHIMSESLFHVLGVLGILVRLLEARQHVCYITRLIPLDLIHDSVL